MLSLLKEIEDEWSDKWFQFILPYLRNWEDEEMTIDDVFEIISKNPFLTIKTVREHSEFPWKWDLLSEHSKIETIVENQDCPWDWNTLSFARPWNEIREHPNLPWNWKQMLSNKTIPFDVFLNLKEFQIDWRPFSVNPSIPLVLLLANFDKISTIVLSERPDLTFEIVRKHPQIQWEWKWLSANPNIPWQTIMENLDQPWVFSGLTARDDFDPKFALDNFSRYEVSVRDDYFTDESFRAWNRESKWNGLSCNKNVSMEFILAHPEFPWRWEFISEWNPNVTWEFIKTHLHLPWDWMQLSGRDFITVEILESSPDLEWDGDALAKNLKIPPQWLVDNFDNLSWETLLEREDITFDFLEKNKEKNFGGGIFHSFLPKEREKFIFSKVNQYLRPLVLSIFEKRGMPLDLVDLVMTQF